jgi:hypothetical protein
MDVTVQIKRSPEGWAATVLGAPQVRRLSMEMDEQLRGKQGRFALVSQFEDLRYQPGPLWIPRAELKAGKETRGGKVVGVQEWEGRRVYVLTGKIGTGAGTRYYDVTEGLLYGFRITSGVLKSQGKRITP